MARALDPNPTAEREVFADCCPHCRGALAAQRPAAVYDHVEGFRDTHDDHPNPVGNVVTMVVVTHPDFEAQLQAFVDWKTERGFRVVVGVLGEGDVGTTKESVRDWLADLYLNSTPEQPAPSFVLFVGDVAQMPTWTVGGDATDLPYCNTEGDLCPDMLYGRFSATNASELQAILDKTLMYDQFTMPDPSYLDAYLWLKVPGESDGSCNGAPVAGAFWEKAAIELVTP